jgi:hypothetical protein
MNAMPIHQEWEKGEWWLISPFFERVKTAKQSETTAHLRVGLSRSRGAIGNFFAWLTGTSVDGFCKPA